MFNPSKPIQKRRNIQGRAAGRALRTAKAAGWGRPAGHAIFSRKSFDFNDNRDKKLQIFTCKHGGIQWKKMEDLRFLHWSSPAIDHFAGKEKGLQQRSSGTLRQEFFSRVMSDAETKVGPPFCPRSKRRVVYSLKTIHKGVTVSSS